MSKPGDYIINEDQYAELVPIINALPDEKAPLQALGQKVEQFFQHGPDAAFAALQNLQDALTGSTYKRKDSRIEIPITSDFGLISKIFSRDINPSAIWKSPKTATTLVLLLACNNDNTETMIDLVADRGRTFGGLPTYESTQTVPTASLPKEFQQAKSLAQEQGKTTVMVISLHDVHKLELDEREEEHLNCYNFSHFFTMGIGPEGVRIWQAWGQNGYRFDDYIRDGHARLRNWEEAEAFVRDFEDLASQEGDWTARVNDLYLRLFHVDINHVCGDDGPEPPVTPKFKAWTRIRSFEDVTFRDVTKFQWVKK